MPNKSQGKLRHIAISVPDRRKSQKFYENSFGMELIRENETPMASVAYMSDGVMSLALIEYKSDEAAGKATSLREEGKDFVGLHHLGFWVDDVDQTKKSIEESGGKYMMGDVSDKLDKEASYYEIKYRDPDNIIVDITHTGWIGAIKEPEKNS
ncbi:MAG: VOC family protein [Rhodospirillales bacterium]|nr:VOC family protein [Rhodospirillales bacterium]MDC0989509.1 VOC family protein [Rhodospirillales bacterium]